MSSSRSGPRTRRAPARARQLFSVASLAATCVLVTHGAARGATVYQATLTPANNSGVNGLATVTIDGNALHVVMDVNGLTPNIQHDTHLHGRFSDGDIPGGSRGTPADSVVPTLANDLDGDGYIEQTEAETTLGPVLLPLTTPPSTGFGNLHFPIADASGHIHLDQVYDLTDSSQFFDPNIGVDFNGDDILPLDLRAIDIHGMSVPDGVGVGTAGEVYGVGGYKRFLPVAAGELVLVPEPATLAAAGSLALLLVGRRRPR